MLPAEYDSRVKAMEVDEKPTEDYTDIGGLDKQIQELTEAVVLPMTHADKFVTLGIRAPKGVLLYGPPGTGKTLIARACAAQTNAAYLKLAGPLLVQMFIGDGAKLVRDAFALAKEKAPAIIFIDEIDAIGTKRFYSDTNGDREVQRTMLELLNQLDGFSSDDRVKIIAATNRADILDPALLRSGRLDRKIEFPHPNEDARAQIMEIHSRKMNLAGEINFDELARSTDDFNAAQLKAVCVEAGMLALRRDGTTVSHEDFNEGIIAVQAKKKADLYYYSLEWRRDALLCTELRLKINRKSAPSHASLHVFGHEPLVRLVHVVERRLFVLAPVELFRQVHVPHLYDPYRRQPAVELLVTDEQLQPLPVPQLSERVFAEERREIVVQLRVARVVVAFVTEPFLLSQHHPHRHHRA